MAITMNLAPLPDHNGVTDPLWQTLYANYAHVITPLRQRGWVTDVELCGGAYFIRVTLGDGTELHIGSADALPTDPRRVDEWLVTRQPENEDNNGPITVLYDSTPEGAHRHHGGHVRPMLERVTRLQAAPAVDEEYQLVTTEIGPTGSRTEHGPREPLTAATTRFTTRAEELSALLWSPVWSPTWSPASEPKPQPTQLLTVWALGPEITVLQIASARR
ncbi:hypothetical protein GCM10010193_57000 [Kitasatospora atroaurantiaca]|uniref:Uncharacterized protein n=1 Tax=Kitasatospora atroaurantiaca TaxID=285545 RepID=A0A561EN04_9ACTN|nr:hypothetical protein [Kitasatospora atroaurantiaca]TWE16949.1 hypothetical protein FB465_1944 [Kitasatospora atroaurantiaca]